MYIEKITYIATNAPATQDDIFTLDITGMKDGAPVRNIMISGHSIRLSGGSYLFGADVDTLEVIATDLDFDGHVIDVGGLQHRIPRTGSITKTYQFDVSKIGATEITKPLIDPNTGYVITAVQAVQSTAVATQVKADVGVLPVEMVQSTAIDTQVKEDAGIAPAVQQAGIGLGALVLIGAGLFALSKRGKR